MVINFEQYQWLQQVYQRLIQQQLGERPSHALLITGIEGLGKSLLIKEVIARIFCNQSTDKYACGTCHSCAWLKAKHHPDLMFLEAEAANKAIRVDEIRALNDFLQLTPQLKQKIAWIDGAHNMNINAANSLLKTLEEPPGHAWIFLSTAHPERLPITIRSRTQIYNIATPSIEQAHTFLAPFIKDSNIANTLLYFSQYAPLLALKRFDEQGHILYRTMIDSFTNSLKNFINIKVFIDLMMANSEFSLDILSIYLHNIICLQLGITTEAIYPHNLHENKILFTKYSVTTLIKQYDELLLIKSRLSTQVRLDWQLESWVMKF